MILELSLRVLLLLPALLSLALVLIGLSSATIFLLPVKRITVRPFLTWLGVNTRQLTHRLFRQRSSGTGLFKWYTWEFPARPTIRQPNRPARFFIELPVDQTRYIEYNQRSRELNASRFDLYVTVTLPEIEALADKLLTLGQTHGFGAYDQLCNALAFVQQNIRYTADLCPQTGKLIEYPKYPIETLVEKRGDCEDRAILAAALLKRMGYEVALLVLPTHVAQG